MKVLNRSEALELEQFISDGGWGSHVNHLLLCSAFEEFDQSCPNSNVTSII